MALGTASALAATRSLQRRRQAAAAPSGQTSLQDLIKQFTQSQQESRAANEAREREIRALNQQGIAQFSPGGSFGRGFLEQIERQKTNTIAQQTQGLVSSGLSNTTLGGNLGAQFEQNVGTPARLQLADVQAQRLSQARGTQAGFIERIQDVGPDPALLSNLVSQAAQQPVASQPRTITRTRRSGFNPGGFFERNFGSGSTSSRPLLSNVIPSSPLRRLGGPISSGISFA